MWLSFLNTTAGSLRSRFSLIKYCVAVVYICSLFACRDPISESFELFLDSLLAKFLKSLFWKDSLGRVLLGGIFWMKGCLLHLGQG